MADDVQHTRFLKAEYWDVPVDVTTHTTIEGVTVTTAIRVRLRFMPTTGNTLVALLVFSPPPECVNPPMEWLLLKDQSAEGTIMQIYYSPNIQPSLNYTWTMQSAPGIVPTPHVKMMECTGVWTPEQEG